MLYRSLRSRTPVIAVVFAILAAGAATAQTTRPSRRPETNPRWFDRLSETDRALLQGLVGYAPPAFTPDLTWVGSDAQAWADLREKVVLIQSWTNRSTAGRNAVKRAEKLAKDSDHTDLRVVLVHTPEGAENLQNFLERREVALPLALDSSGTFCDDVGFYKEPTNVLVDRNGVVRLVGLNSRGLAAGIETLLAEPFDPSVTPAVRGEETAETPAVEFPTFSVPVHDATDLRGKPAPPFYIDTWETPRPNPRGKVVVLNFWSTDCDVCVDLLDKMNAIADTFRNDVCVVSVSDESSSNFKEGRAEHRIRDNDFRHAVALDTSNRMKNAMGVRHIPHCAVISSDWVVRWQGHPGRLERDVVSRIVRADRAQGPGVSTPERPRRWARDGQ